MRAKIKVSLAEQISEIERELAFRKNVFGSWVRSGKMKPETADKMFAAMRAALHTLLELQNCKEANKGVYVWPHDEIARDREEEGLPE
jgi:hypothetical protein